MSPIKNLSLNGFVIEEDSLSIAWAKAYLEASKSKGRILKPLIVCITGFDEDNKVKEDSTIRSMIDSELAAAKKQSVHTVANTIFPEALWDIEKGRQELYTRYFRILPYLTKLCWKNENGLYFQRMIEYPSAQSEDFSK